MEQPELLNSANAEELANIAQETGAEVLRGPLRYPSETGGWRLGDLDLSAHLSKYRDHEITVIIAATGEAERERFICGICGFVMDEARECPRCKEIDAEIVRRLKAKQERGAALLCEVEEILRDEDK
jgi:rubrerythrin